MKNAKIEKMKCDIFSNFQTMCEIKDFSSTILMKFGTREKLFLTAGLDGPNVLVWNGYFFRL